MKNKYDARRPDRPPTSAPSSKTEPLAHKATDCESSAGNGGPRRRRTKGGTEMPSKDTKDANAELLGRYNAIGTGLKRIFNEIVEEPIPREFLDLLDKIDLKREQ